MTSPDWANSIVHQAISRDMSFSRSSLITPIPRVTGTPNGRLWPPSRPATYAGWYSLRERARRHGVPGEPCALSVTINTMSNPDAPDVHQVSRLDGAVAELIDRDEVAGWVAIRTEHFRNLLLAEQLGCWLLFTWADGALEIEEDFPPYALVPELLAGTFTDPDRRTIYEVRWIREDRIEDHWGRYGVHHPAGHYMAIAARQRRGQR
jgi:hypothetical protein